MFVTKSIGSLFFVLVFGSQVFSQEVILDRGISLDSAFSKASKVFNVNFAYNPSIIDQDFIINKDLTVSSPNELLGRVLPKSITWKYIGSTIVISKENNELETSSSETRAQVKPFPEKEPQKPLPKKAEFTELKLKKIPVSPITFDSGLKPIIRELEPTLLENPDVAKENRKIIWGPHLSSFVYQQTAKENNTQTQLYGIGAGISFSAHKNKWTLNASLSYNQILHNSSTAVVENLFSLDSTGVSSDSTSNDSTSTVSSVALENLENFIHYSAGIGYSFQVSPSLIIPIELGVSAIQVLGTTEAHNKLLYNVYLTTPFNINSQKNQFLISPFVEVGLNSDFKEIESNRFLFGLKAGLRF